MEEVLFWGVGEWGRGPLRRMGKRGSGQRGRGGGSEVEWWWWSAVEAGQGLRRRGKREEEFRLGTVLAPPLDPNLCITS